MATEHLKKAYALDPAGETDEFRELREKAVEKAKPPVPTPSDVEVLPARGRKPI